MLVITGTQRSGTSFAATFFKNCGFDLGSTLWHEDINGGLENIQVCSFFRRYLGDTTFPFSDYPFDDTRHFSSIEHEVIKFSFMLMVPTIPYIWNKFRGSNDKFLVLKRPFDHVCASKKRMNRFSSDSILLQQSPEQLAHNFNQSLEIFSNLGFEYEILEFPDLLKDFKLFAESIYRLGVDISKQEKAWIELVDFKKVHFGIRGENGKKS